MSTPSSANPFEQPYPESQTSAAAATAAAGASPAPPAAAASGSGTPSRPTLVIPDGHDQPPSPPTEPSSLAHSRSDSPEHSRPQRRVQWPAELSEHVSIQMASPTSRSLTDEGGQDALRRALEEHSKNPDEPFDQRYIGQSGSEAPSRAASSDGDPEERMDEMREQMDVWVDPGETDGLPTIGNKGVEAKANKAAWGLVRGYTSGGFGFRQRKNAGFKGGQGVTGEHEKMRGEDKDEGGFFKHAFRNDNDLSATEPPSGRRAPQAAGAPGGGILSALIALQQQQQQGDGQQSGATSGATTPTSLAPSSRPDSAQYSSDDEEEEAAERAKFLKKMREKRANRTALQKGVDGAAGMGKGVAGGALGVVGGVGKGVFGGATQVVGGVGHAVGLGGSKSHSRTHSGAVTPGAASGTGTPPQQKKKGLFDEATSGLKNIGGKLGLDLDAHDRPDAARSGAGVMGGLMLSAGNIAGAAAPAATTLAPNVERPGYHLSRYSAPLVPSTTRRSEDGSHRQHGASLDASRAGTPDTDSPKSKAASETLGGTPPGSPPIGTPAGAPSHGGGKKKPGFMLDLKQLQPHTPKFGFHSSGKSSHDNSPKHELGAYFAGGGKETEEQREQREWEKEKKRRRKVKEKKKAQEVFITMHVAAILERQQFIMKLARSFMMFGAPSHRLEAQMQATARVLEINCQVIYIPGVMLISFGDAATHTSEIKFLKQANGLDLGKLLAAYMVYYNVIYDKISVTDASIELDELMTAGPKYNLWQNMIIGGLASAFIQPSAFYGSFIDCLVAMPLGALLVLVQVVVSRNDLYSSLFEIVIACINAFLAAALASTKRFCFAAVASGSVVLILPGYIVLCGSLELANRSIISGSVRLVYSILYSLFLGFGLAMGSEVYQRITGLTIYGATDYTCSSLRGDVPWYQSTIPPWWYFLTIPAFLLMLSLRNGQPFYRKETILMLLIGSAGFVGNYFSGKAFPGRSDIVSAIGSFVVGFLGNIYGKFTRGSPFVVMVAGVLLQLPSGLANGGLLQFAADNSDSNTTTNSYSAGFSTAESLVEVAIGLTVGLFVSAAVVNSLGGGRRRGTHLSSF